MKSLNRLLQGILLLCLSSSAFSQITTDTTFATQMNYAFAPLDKSRVPYGILRDYGMEFTDLNVFNGTASLVDSNDVDAAAFWDVYNSLLMSIIYSNASGFLRPDTLDNRWHNHRLPGQITLAGLYFNYSRFRDDAYPNYITITNNQLYDKFVNGVWQNPYVSQAAFVLAPSVTQYEGTSFSLFLPSDIWLTNSASSISSISVDVNDGNGYRTLTPGVPLSVNYADTGYKEWTYKLTLTNASNLYAHSSVHILPSVNSSGGDQGYTVGSITITAAKAFDGVKGTANVTVDYANADLKFRKPLIVVEGFDPWNILDPENPTGFTNISTFHSSIDNSNSYNLESLLGSNVNQYDIVYIDWNNGTDYLERNAYVLESVIDWVNNKKASDGISTEPDVVWGQSMGGVIARYALKDMENNGDHHQVRLFISHDAPQQGANVPEGYQHAARQARDFYIRTGYTGFVISALQPFGFDPYKVLSLADQPASKEMLINYVDANNVITNTVHATWETTLKNMGYPSGDGVVAFRKVDVSNGSECATLQPFSAGDLLISYSGTANTRFLGSLLGQLVLPFGWVFLNQPSFLLGVLPGRNTFNFDLAINSQADGISNRVYYGKLSYTKKILGIISITSTLTNRTYNSSASNLPYDNFPGGYYDLRDFGLDMSNSSFQNALVKFHATAYEQPIFSFIPTPSSLDIGSGAITLTKSDYLTSYVGANPPAPPKNTPFDNFIAAYYNGSNDEPHIFVEKRNGDWIADELNGNHPVANCSFLCNSSGITISGPSTVCNSPVVYTLNNPPTGTTRTWSATPSGIVSISPSADGTQATVSMITNGNFTLHVAISNTDCGTLTIDGSTMRAGGYGSSDYPVSGPSTASCNSYVTYITNQLAGATNYAWFYPGTWTYISGQGTYTLTLRTNNVSGNYQVGVRVANACDAGGSPGIKNTYLPSCGFAFTTSPNPTTGSITVSAQTQMQTATPGSPDKIYQIKIIDQNGIVMKQFNYTGGVTTTTINLSGLVSGIYSLQVFNGTVWSTQSIIKQ